MSKKGRRARSSSSSSGRTVKPAGRSWKQSEEQLQKAVVQFLSLVSRGRFRYFAVPNGGHLSVSLGGRRKAQGAKAGAPDILIETRGGKVLEIELKTDKGRLSKTQRAWQKESFELGVPYFVCRSVEDVQSVLRGAGLL